MKLCHFWIAAASLVLAGSAIADAPATPAAPSAQTYALRYKWTPGKSLAYQFTMDANINFTGGPGGQALPMAQHMDAVMRQNVTDVRASDGAATIAMSFDSLKMTMNGKDVPFTPEQLAQMKTIGTVTMLPTGKVLSFQRSPGQAEMMPGMSSMMFQSNGSFPDGPVKIGDDWKTTIAMSTVGMQVSALNKLLGVTEVAGHNTADIKTTVAGKFVPTAQSNTALPMNMYGTLAGSSDMTFDIDAGEVSNQEGTADVDMTLVPKQAAGGTKAQVPMKMKMTAKTKLTLLPPPPAAPVATP